MSKHITISSPGKLMLFGEYAVMHGSDCIVTAVDKRVYVKVEPINEEELYIDAPGVAVKGYKKKLNIVGENDIPKGVQFIEHTVKRFLEKYPQNKGISIQTTSDFSSTIGFGSSAAIAVSTVFALGKLFEKNLTCEEIFEIAYKAVLDVQQKGSGFDIAASIYGGTICFSPKNKKVVRIPYASLPLVIGYSGMKADTVGQINLLEKRFEKKQAELLQTYKCISQIVSDAKNALETKNLAVLGTCMTENQSLLEKLGVSTDKLNRMIQSALLHGAYGAKLSGAGGGDCMIALVDKNKSNDIEKAIVKVGGEIIHANTNAQGVRIEK